jgi:hypothetical protein
MPPITAPINASARSGLSAPRLARSALDSSFSLPGESYSLRLLVSWLTSFLSFPGIRIMRHSSFRAVNRPQRTDSRFCVNYTKLTSVVNRTLESREQASPETLVAVDTPLEPQNTELYAIRPLPERATVAGHLLQKVWRKDNVAVFARSIAGKAPHEYEVIIEKIAPAAVSPSGSVIPVREEYPSSNKWGKYAWSIPKQNRAYAWAEMVLSNLAKPQRERMAWPELFSQFKRKIIRN